MSTPAGAVATAVTGGAMTHSTSIVVIVVMIVLIVVGMAFVIDGAVEYVIYEDLLTEIARNCYIMYRCKYNMDNDWKKISADDFKEAYEKKYNSINIALMAIGGLLVVGGTVTVCVLGSKWKKEGLI